MQQLVFKLYFCRNKDYFFVFLQMYLYNITYNINDEIHKHWLQWMRKIHIPEVLKNSNFSAAKLIKVLMDEELGGITYSVQYQADTKEKLNLFLNNSTFNTFEIMSKEFPNQFVTFSTELKVVEEFMNPSFFN